LTAYRPPVERSSERNITAAVLTNGLKDAVLRREISQTTVFAFF
jgi:hypothetical protein